MGDLGVAPATIATVGVAPGTAPVVAQGVAPPPADPGVTPPAEPAPPAEPGTITTDRFGDFRDQMHADIRGNDAFKDMKGMDDLGHAYLNRLDGYVRKPGGEATDEEVAQFHQEMGVPETVEAYSEVFADLTIPEGIEADKDFLQAAANKAFELNMYPDQLAEMLNWYYGELGQSEQATNDANLRAADDTVKQMKREWGADYRANVATVDSALNAFGGDKLIDWAEATGVASDPTFMRLMLNVGKVISENSMLPGVPTPGGKKEKQTHLTYKTTPSQGQM